MATHLTDPLERLAAIARSTLILLLKVDVNLPIAVKPFALRPDYQDFLKALRPYLEKELLLVRLDEARLRSIAGREAYLANQLTIAEKAIETLEMLLLGRANES